MFEIVFTACSIMAPDLCETHYVATSAPNELVCMAEIQPSIAQQVRAGLFDGESWVITSFGCERSRWLG